MIFAERGFGIRKQEVVQVVAEFCNHTKQKVTFHDSHPVDDWWHIF